MSEKIKIIFPVGTLFPDESGGVSLSLYWLLKGLHNTEIIETRTITTSFGTIDIPENKWFKTDYGDVIYLKTKNLRLGFEICKEFIKWVSKYKIVHLSGVLYPPSFICFFISRFFNKKVIWSTHGSIDDVEFKKSKFIKSAVIFFLKPFIKNVIFHTTSTDETLFLKKRFGGSVNYVQITNFMLLPNRLNKEKESFFLFIGRFHAKKGLDILLKALNNSKLFNNSKFRLKIAGNYKNEYGQYIIELKNSLQISDKVDFLGHIKGNEKQELISKSHFLFMPSFSENFGIVAAEALAQGVPVVASIYTPWLCLNEYIAGFCIDNTVDCLSDIIDKVLQLSESEYNKYSANALKLAKDELDISTNIYKWLEVYTKSLN